MTILVIDDSKTVRQYHKEILEEAGCITEEAENGMEAIEKCVNRPYDLFLVDVNMPVMDGYSFTESVRKMERFIYTPIIMISTEAEEIDRVKAYNAGCTLYYTKPVKPDILSICLKILLG